MGLIFHRDSIKLSELSTDFALYPQIELSLCTFFDYGAEYLVSRGVIHVGEGLPLEERFTDKMSRPLDYGIIERFNILKRLRVRYSIGVRDYFRCYLSLVYWGNNIFFKLISAKPCLAKKFAWENFARNPDKLLLIVSQCYLLMKALSGNLKSHKLSL